MKNDTAENWATASTNGFIPKLGEPIFYKEQDGEGFKFSMKIGDGIRTPDELPVYVGGVGTVITADNTDIDTFFPVDEDEEEDQIALAGAYTADGTFSNRVYTWDELVARSENYEEPYADIKKESETELYASSYDLVVPDTQTYAGYFYCKNIVLPKTTTYIGGTDTSNDIRVYVKATVPPTLDEYAFFEHAEIELDGYVGGGSGYTVEIIVPIGYGDIYKAATNWSLYADYITEGGMPI